MNPALSRRVASAINALPLHAIPLRRRFDIGPAVEAAGTFDQLPDWLQALTIAGETAGGRPNARTPR